MSLIRKESRPTGAHDLFSRFDAMFDEWTKSLPFRREQDRRWPLWMGDDMIRVDEFNEAGALVIRAELPGIDPDQDVELTVADGMLHIEAQRRAEEKEESKGYIRHELRSGSFTRSLPLPEGVSEDDIVASYKNGILEIRVPMPEPPSPTEPKRIPVQKA